MEYVVIGFVVCAIIALIGWALWLESPARARAPRKPRPLHVNHKPAITTSELRLRKQALAWRLVREYQVCDAQAWNIAVDIVDGKLEK